MRLTLPSILALVALLLGILVLVGLIPAATGLGLAVICLALVVLVPGLNVPGTRL